MNTDLILKYDVELCKSLPICFEGVNLYPILFKDKKNYNLYLNALTYNPIYYQDTEISALPRLYFLTDVLRHSDDKEYLEKNKSLYGLFISLYALLKMVLHDQQFEFKSNNAGYFCLYIYPNENSSPVVINASKFNTIREIILIQNNTDYDDTYVHPDIQKWIDEQKRIEASKQKDKSISTIEDQIESMMIEFKNPDESFLDNMTIRRVDKLFEKMTNREIYNAQMSGMMSGMVQFKEQPISWMTTRHHQSDFEKYLKPLK